MIGWIILIICLIALAGLIVCFRFQFNPINTMEVSLPDPLCKIYAIKEGNVNYWGIKSKNNFIFIDAGYGKNLMNECQKLALIPEEVSHVFLTHSDFDHRRGLKFFSNAQIHLSKQEEKLVKGEIKRFWGIYSNDPLDCAYSTFEDGEIIDLGDIRVECILTPGHTEGHTAYLINSKYLFTGDTLRIKNTQIKPFFRFINKDTKEQINSIKKIMNIITQDNIKMIFSAHTGYSTDIESLMKSELN